MTITEAISKAKELGNWAIVPHEPASVDVMFIDKECNTHETTLDLYSDSKEKELERLWNNLCNEFSSTPASIESVEAYGYAS